MERNKSSYPILDRCVAFSPSRSRFIKSSIAVLGLGVSGLAALEMLKKMNIPSIGLDSCRLKRDRAKEVYPGARFFNDLTLEVLGEIKKIIISPGISPWHPFIQKAISLDIPKIGELGFAACYLPKNVKVIGVTGTNGKSTLVKAASHVLTHAGYRAKAAGNIGEALASFYPFEGTEIFVIELSSYQLEELDFPFLDTGVILNVQEDHLDRYKNMQAYAEAKGRIGNCIKKNGTLWIESKAYQEFFF